MGSVFAATHKHFSMCTCKHAYIMDGQLNTKLVPLKIPDIQIHVHVHDSSRLSLIWIWFFTFTYVCVDGS